METLNFEVNEIVEKMASPEVKRIFKSGGMVIKGENHTSYIPNEVENSSPKVIWNQDELNYYSGILPIWEKKNVISSGMVRLTDRVLKTYVRLDLDISSIIETRVAQTTVFAHESENKFDRGFTIRSKNDNISEEQLHEVVKWIEKCGMSDDSIFKGKDSYYSRYSFSDYIQSQTRNILVFGRCARENILVDGRVEHFRPIPVEMLHPIRIGEFNHTIEIIKSNKINNEESVVLSQFLNENQDIPAWCEIVNNKISQLWLDKQITLSYWQKQAEMDLQNIPYAPLELCLSLTTLSQGVHEWLVKQFQGGILNSGILNLKTEDGTSLDDETIDHIADYVTNVLAGNSNSARVPVLSGNFDIQVTPLMGEKDLQWQEARWEIKRVWCSIFQISPEELSWGKLGDTSSMVGSTQLGKSWEQSEEHGLRSILDILADDIQKAVDSKFGEDTFEFVFTGIGIDSREEALERASKGQQIYSSQNDINKSIGLELLDKESGGDVILSPMFHQNVIRYMMYGDFMERFFGKKGWGQKPEFQFIIDPTLNQGYMQMLQMQQQSQMQQTQPQQQEQDEGLRGGDKGLKGNDKSLRSQQDSKQEEK